MGLLYLYHNFMYGLTERNADLIRVYFSADPGYLVPFQSANRFSNANGQTWASLIHTYVHIYIHEHKHTYIHSCIHAYKHTGGTLDSTGIKLFVLAALKEH